MNQVLPPTNLLVWILAASLVIAVIAVSIYHVFVAGPALQRARALLELHDGLLAGEGSGSAAAWFERLDRSRAELAQELERVARRTGELEALSHTDLSRVGFVRYDAFDDTGSELSYALALLNREGDGIVLTSIYSRTDTRTYGKAVEKFVTATAASGEELRAIEMARRA